MNTRSFPNPFDNTIVADPWRPLAVDVSSIHAAAFEKCRQTITAVLRDRRSYGLLFHGEKGVGKTHLLARLTRYFTPENLPKDRDVVFVAVRLQTSPRRIWQHVRQTLVDDLLRKTNGRSQLERILIARFAKYLPAPADRDWWTWFLRTHSSVDHRDHVLLELFERLSDDVNFDLARVLIHLLQGRHRMAAKAWLRGERLPASELERLGLFAGEAESAELDAEQQAHDVTLSLCKLAGSSTCLVFCFDQVEAMQSDGPGEHAFQVYGEMVASLHDETENLALISSIQSHLAPRLVEQVPRYAIDRMISYGETTLGPLKFDQAAALVEARLTACHELEAERKGRSQLHPIDDSVLRSIVEPNGATPRKILADCAAAFDRWQRGAVTRVDLTDFLTREWAERQEKAISRIAAADTDALLDHAAPMLLGLADGNWSCRRPTNLQDVDLVLSGDAEGRVGVSFCNQENMTSLAGRLRRLKQLYESDDRPPVEKLVLIRHPSLSISATAKAARKNLDWLEHDAGAVVLHPSAEALAALQALRELISETRSGKLAHGGDPVDEATLTQWLRKHLSGPLEDLLGDLVGKPDFEQKVITDDSHIELEENLAELLNQHRVLALQSAVESLGCTAAQIQLTVSQRPSRFGVIEGNQPVLFQVVPDRASAV